SDTNNWRFKAASPPPPPVITNYDPVTGSDNVFVTDTLYATFNEAIEAGTGYINLKLSSDSSVVFSYSSTDSHISIINDTIVQITHPALQYETSYFVNIDTGFVKSVSSGADFNGISNATEWTFTTMTTPKVTAYSPQNGSTTVGITDTLILVFNDTISLGNGSFNIKLSSDSSSVELLDVTSTNISIVNDTMLYVAHAPLQYETQYFINIDSAFVKSANTGADYLGINNATDWHFTTNTTPKVTAYSPQNGSTTVGITDTLILVFNDTISLGSGSFNIKLSSDSSSVELLDVTSTNVSIVNDTMLYVAHAPLQYKTQYFINIDSAFVKSANTGADYLGINNATDWYFTTNTTPKATAYFPETNSTTAEINDTLRITFNDTIKLGTTGYFKINLSSDSSSFAILDTQSPNLSIINDTVLAITHELFDYETEYFINIDSGFIKSAITNADFLGINTATEWTFKTKVAPPPPYVTQYIPAAGDTTVRLDETLKIVFNEPIKIGPSGLYLKIKQVSDSSNLDVIETIDTKLLILNDTILTITHLPLLQDTSYFVTIEPGFIISTTTNVDYPGISDATEWTFRAIKVRNWVGSNSTDWNAASEWDSNGGFVNGAVVTIPATATYFPVISSDTVEIADLTIDAGGGLTIDANSVVTVDSIIELLSNTTANAYLLCDGTLNYNPANVRIHQNIEASTRWYYITSPVIGATGSTIGCDGDIWYWDNADGLWRTAGSSDILADGKGYVLWSNNDLVFTGPIRTGDFTATLEYGRSVGWNLIGNPYTNSINWNNVILADSVFNGFWMYLNLDDVYGSYNGSTNQSVNGVDSIIPSNHCFWVRSDTTETQTITFTAASKSIKTNTYLKGTAATTTYPVFKFAANCGTYSDEVLVAFANPDDTPLRLLDMTKKFTTNENYIQPYFTKGSKSLCMNGVEEFSSEAIIPFTIRIDTANHETSFSIRKTLIENFPDDISILLHDTVTDDYIDFLTQDTYYFTETNHLSTTSDYYETDRFELIFKGDISTAIKEDTGTDTNNNNDIYLVSGEKQFTVNIKNEDIAEIKVYNISGQLIGDYKNIISQKVIGVPTKGIYIVHISQGETVVTKKVLVK
ncbi:MAG: T9SS type A sorting domain-containing protein, partial [Chlorobi bacterium]|nr:T9SS type A sorting domain-containing protein [Chlorobiota bacterium]